MIVISKLSSLRFAIRCSIAGSKRSLVTLNRERALRLPALAPSCVIKNSTRFNATGQQSSIIPPAVKPPTQSEEEEAEAKRKSQIRATKWSLVVGLGFATLSVALWGISEWGPPRVDDSGNLIEDEFSKLPLPVAYCKRSLSTLFNYNEALKEPARELLLPDPLQAPYLQPPYTLVIETNGVLMHPDWTYKTGWRFKKRPFVEYLLQQCGPPLFEVVVFTQDPGTTAYPLIDSLDPNGYIMYRLFRDSTRYIDGQRIKDLNCLNRDLSKVIFIDWDKDACKLNPDNCLTLPKWEGNEHDKTLFDLAQFLRAIATQEVKDVREVIHHYKQFDNPLGAFQDRQRKILEEEDKLQKQETSKTVPLTSAFKRFK